MVAEILGGISALKSAFDIAMGLKDIDDAARRNTAVIELQEKIAHRNVHHHRFWRQQLAAAWDWHLIAEPEGPSFISRTVAHRRLDRRCSW
jgi:hypothetical protein